MATRQQGKKEALGAVDLFSGRSQKTAKGGPRGFPVILIPLGVVIVALIAVVATGLIGGPKAKFSPDTVLGSYEHDGEKVDITVQDLLDSGVVIDGLWDADGEDAPAHALLRNYALWDAERREAKGRGLDVSKKEAEAFLEDVAPDGIDAYAGSMGLETEQLIVRTATLLSIDALKEEIDGGAELMPTLSVMSSSSELRRQYGACIARLLGDAWDAESDAWAAQEGQLYEALNWLDFSTKAASYDIAWAVWQSVSLAQGLSGGTEETPWQEFEADLSTDVYGTLSFAFDEPALEAAE